ncbi:TonB-dependent receptor [Aestuariicella hydrocarbonica]|uniref:TonB-dependent receptor n=1 Tax=Pseudomaricurvus hydrocarbonicus TaxID=1470433 RepID=A0A9E5MNX6_9GAMM|nr:TonB-dependent receptor [Aestuariicella hydrocarbonica]NHO67766.1 TonB-dependent receptor [Aestuariicella hydrocarbonica]
MIKTLLTPSRQARKQLLASTISVATMAASAGALAAQIEEVVVTAQKRAQSVNDIGVSASAFGGEDLKKLKMESAVDLGAHTPGLATTNATSGGTPIFAIRGIGLDDFSPNNNSGVGIYTDEVFASAPALLNGQLFDIERVEVLKGPQGTLYGKNTTGGAINFISNKPTDDVEAYVEADYSRWNTVEMTGAVSGALNERVRGRVAMNYVDQGEGWQKDVNTGNEYGKADSHAIRGLLDFDLGDNTTALLKAYYTRDTSTPLSPDAEQHELWGYPELNSPKDPAKVTVGNLDVGRDEEGHGISLNLTTDFEAFTLTSITAWDSYDQEVVDNYGGTSERITDFFQDNQIEQMSQEFRFTGNTSGAFSWILGFNYSHEVVEALGIFDDSFVAYETFGDVGTDLLVADYEQVTDSLGAYLHTETDLTDTLSLTVGLRYSQDERSFDGTDVNTDADGSFYDVLIDFDETHKEDDLTGKIGLDWALADNWLIYGNVATSYKSGLYYGAPVLDPDPGVAWAYVDPEEVLSYELGFKATLLDNSLQINGAAFILDYKNRQSLITYLEDDFSTYLGLDVYDTTMISIPESQTEGAELDVHWLPSEGLEIRLGVAYLNSKVTKAPSTADMRGISDDPNSPNTVDHISNSIGEGQVLAQSPEWSYNGMVGYEWFVGSDLIARVQTSASWVDEQYAALGDPNTGYGPISSLDAQFSLTNADDQWAVTLWGKNLEGNEAETYAFSGFAGRVVYRQQPTSYGVTFRYNF